MKYLHKFATLTLLASAAGLTVAGCGGGGGSPQTASTGFAAAGFWGGPFVVGGVTPVPASPEFWNNAATDVSHVGLVILPTGETWMIDIIGGSVTNAGHGQAQVAGSSATIYVTGFSSTSMGSDSYTGSIVPQSQLNLTLNSDSNSESPPPSLSATYDARYAQPATLGQLADTYTGTGNNGSGTYYSLPASTTASSTTSTTAGTSTTATGTDAPAGGAPSPPAAFSPLGNNYVVTISSTGAVTLPPDPLGCGGAGTATPRTDSNVFNLSIRFSGSQCVLGNGVAVNGIAVVESGHLLMMATPPSGSNPSGEFVYVSN